jgi:hypothetical protein
MTVALWLTVDGNVKRRWDRFELAGDDVNGTISGTVPTRSSSPLSGTRSPSAAAAGRSKQLQLAECKLKHMKDVDNFCQLLNSIAGDGIRRAFWAAGS